MIHQDTLPVAVLSPFCLMMYTYRLRGEIKCKSLFEDDNENVNDMLAK